MVEKIMFEVECPKCHTTIQNVRTRKSYIRTKKTKNRIAFKFVKGTYELRIKQLETRK